VIGCHNPGSDANFRRRHMSVSATRTPKIADQHSELPGSRNTVLTPCASWPALSRSTGDLCFMWQKLLSHLRRPTPSLPCGRLPRSLMILLHAVSTALAEHLSADSNSTFGGLTAGSGTSYTPSFHIHLHASLHTSYAIVWSTCLATMSSTSPRRSWPPGQRRTMTTPTS
jgi:hypothetical protein